MLHFGGRGFLLLLVLLTEGVRRAGVWPLGRAGRGGRANKMGDVVCVLYIHVIFSHYIIYIRIVSLTCWLSTGVPASAART